jgi:hypothetical protein
MELVIFPAIFFIWRLRKLERQSASLAAEVVPA